MPTNLKRKLVIGTTTLAVAAFAGGAFAATQEAGISSRQAFLNDLAKRLNVTPKQLSAAVQGAYLDQLQEAVAVGRLTQAQASVIKQRLQQSGGIAPLGGWRWFGPIDHGGPLPPGAPTPPYGPVRPGGSTAPYGALPPGGSTAPYGSLPPDMPLPPGMPLPPPGSTKPYGPLPPGVPGFHGFRGLLRPGAGAPGPLAAASKYLGVTPTQLFDQLKAGKSLAQVARARGKTVVGLKAAIGAAERARLDKLVAAKLITAAQEQQILRNLSAGLDARINAAGLMPRWRLGRPGLRGPAKLTPAQAPSTGSAD